MRQSVPSSRIRVLHGAELHAQGEYVLYWMTSARRTRFNYALDRAVELARSLRRPLVILEALRVDYPWASDRLHRFVLNGMRANQRSLENKPVLYYPYVEPRENAGRGLLREMASHACAVVTDDFPSFFLPHMLESAGRQVLVRMEAIDSNGLFPMRATDRVFARAHDFRRFLQRELPSHLGSPPRSNALARANLPRLKKLPESLTRRWPRADANTLDAGPSVLGSLPIDHEVTPVAMEGGAHQAQRRLAEFLGERLGDYGELRNHPDHSATSGLSPYLHFGHLSVHQVLDRIADHEDWFPERVSPNAHGKRAGWWNMSVPAEEFLDQLVTWRELGYNLCAHRPDHDRFESLPDWAHQTLDDHAKDTRPHVYTPARFELAKTHDLLWNAAQNQLREDGTIHNYLRMLWGKKILHWSRSPRAALKIMIHLNNKYALDGRNPNSYSGIFWVLGRYDRAWGPERPVFGKVRYMTSDNTQRKLRVRRYIRRFTAARSAEQ